MQKRYNDSEILAAFGEKKYKYAQHKKCDLIGFQSFNKIGNNISTLMQKKSSYL